MVIRLIALAALSMLVAPAVFAADALEFRKVDVFITENGDQKKKDARLEIDSATAEIRLVDEKRGAARAVYAVIPVGDIDGLVYEVEVGNTWGGHVGVLPAKHWLTIRAEALPSGYLRLRLDKDNQRELRFALRAATGMIEAVVQPAR